jgi:hypothetical protein
VASLGETFAQLLKMRLGPTKDIGVVVRADVKDTHGLRPSDIAYAVHRSGSGRALGTERDSDVDIIRDNNAAQPRIS